MPVKYFWAGIIVLLSLTPGTPQAQEPHPKPPENAAPASQEDEPPRPDAPSLELLEFLGDWETEEGEWVGPAEWELPVPAQETYDEENALRKN